VRPELEKATAACVKAIADAATKMQKAIEAAFAKMEQAVLKALPAPVASAAPDPSPVLAALQAALARVTPPTGATASSAPATAPITPPVVTVPPPPPPPPGTPITSEQLRAGIRQAYDHLCRFVEFSAKLVEIPPLYRETARRVPGLSLEQFHRELEALSGERKIELHKLNEVHAAKDRHLAIEKDDRLYYYVFWK
jgi:hypothetical protein